MTFAALIAAFLSTTPAAAKPAPIMCPMIYAPVCAAKNGVRSTYGSDCMARGARARILHRGPCGGPRPMACTREYRPVCALGEAGRKTYGNACMARADGARIIRRGPC